MLSVRKQQRERERPLREKFGLFRAKGSNKPLGVIIKPTYIARDKALKVLAFSSK